MAEPTTLSGPIFVPDTPLDEPRLGLATSEQLIRELIARFRHDGDPGDVDRALVLAEMVGRMSAASREYRTVDA